MNVLHPVTAAFSVRKNKCSKAVATGALATVLLLGANAASAQTVILDGDNVIRIENLEIVLDQGGLTVFDMDFVFDTRFNVYGAGLVLPFTEEDAVNVVIHVNNVLSANNPVPTGAGPLGTNHTLLGVIKPR